MTNLNETRKMIDDFPAPEALFAALERFLFADGGLAAVFGLRPEEVAAVADLGDRMLEAGRLADAVTLYEGCLLCEPDNLQTLCRLGTARHLQGDPPGAAACFDQARALATAPEARAAITALGRSLAGGAGRAR